MSNTNANPENKTPNPGTKDALKAENDALKAELKATSSVVPDKERVAITVPKGYANDEPNLLISVNGENYLLPRGKTSVVPKFIADEFYRSLAAQEALDKRVEELLEAFSK